ncbi:hypothetical protein [Williamsia sp. R60]
MLLEGAIVPGDTVHVDVSENALSITVRDHDRAESENGVATRATEPA